MVASIQHRFSANFSFLANYTWSHCIDIEDNPGDIAGTTVQNPANIKGINRTADSISATSSTAPWWCRATFL
jgi:hypothetical protein